MGWNLSPSSVFRPKQNGKQITKKARTCASVVPPIECPDDSVATAHPEQVICYSATGCTESDCCQPRLLCAVDFNEEACLALNQTFTRNASQACRDAVVCTAADCCIAGFFSLRFSSSTLFFVYMCVENVVDFLFFFSLAVSCQSDTFFAFNVVFVTQFRRAQRVRFCVRQGFLRVCISATSRAAAQTATVWWTIAAMQVEWSSIRINDGSFFVP